MTASPDPQPTFAIGVVAERTGVPANTLRTWERRYGVVEPLRTTAGTRRYTREHIERLRLVRELTEEGHSLASLAAQDTASLRLLTLPDGVTGPAPRAVAVLGPKLVARAPWQSVLGPGRVAHAADVGADLAKGAAAELVVADLDALARPEAADLQGLMARLGARRAVVTYSFATEDTRRALRGLGAVLLRHPFDRDELACAVEYALSPEPPVDTPDALPPGPRFGPAQLARLGASSPQLACECPQHLASLIEQLQAFERYSARCVVEQPADGDLHAQMAHVTGWARARMEGLLLTLCAHEGIDPDAPQ